MGCTETDCRGQGLRPLDMLEPDEQATLIAHLAQQARVVRLALDDARSDASALAQDVERALGRTMDAEADADEWVEPPPCAVESFKCECVPFFGTPMIQVFACLPGGLWHPGTICEEGQTCGVNSLGECCTCVDDGSGYDPCAE